MNKQNHSGRTMQPYTAPICETFEMVPECMICQQSEPGTLGDFTDNRHDYFNPWQ